MTKLSHASINSTSSRSSKSATNAFYSSTVPSHTPHAPPQQQPEVRLLPDGASPHVQGGREYEIMPDTLAITDSSSINSGNAQPGLMLW
jgi:hypothetical protein